MKSILILMLACSLPVLAQKPKAAAAPAAPAYKSAQDVKVYWYNKMPIPRRLDQDFKEMTDARGIFVLDVKGGKYDDLADKTAADHNAEVAMEAGDQAAVAFYTAKSAASATAMARKEEAAERRREDAERRREAVAQANATEAARAAAEAANQKVKSDLDSINSQLFQLKAQRNRP